MKWPYKATLQVNQLSNIDLTQVEIMSDGCGVSTLARSLDYVSYLIIRWCYKHCCCR